jgi:ubiquinone/menaquinone biosynthesis C-methylase UbiE
MKSLLRWFVGVAARRLPASVLEPLVTAAMAEKAGALDPASGLRLLFRIDNELYGLEGNLAKRYGGGEHTKHRHMGYHQFFARRIGEGQRVLDIGCGTGAVSRDIAQSTGAEVVGIDQEASNIEQARNRYAHPRVRYVVGDALTALPQERFDVVVLSNVLEHLPGRVEFLKAVVRSAQPERILIRVPLFERDWRIPLKKELGVEWRLDATHETEYTLEEFAAEIAAAGLRIVEQQVRWGEIWAEVAPGA